MSRTVTTLTAQALAERLGGRLEHCPPERVISEVKPLEEAGAASVSFLANPRYVGKAKESPAGLILVDAVVDLADRPVLRVKHPYWSFAPGHPLAASGAGGRVERHAGTSHGRCSGRAVAFSLVPQSVLARCLEGNACCTLGSISGDDCVLGDGCELFAGVVLYRRTRLGNRVTIHANAVVGSDGYGYVLVEGRHDKIPQVGWVEVGDDVEIGACTSIDRGVLGPTRIGTGTKIDNQVQVGHNVKVGQHCLLVSQTGISGSTQLGDFVTLAGKVGVVGHIEIGSRSVVGGNSVVAKSLPEGSFVTGYPARPHRQWTEAQAALNRLPAFMKQLRKG
jgi:UDP-3-O-[3-hydroxymyristoyl] glucosamine N-acyltransferase